DQEQSGRVYRLAQARSAHDWQGGGRRLVLWRLVGAASLRRRADRLYRDLLRPEVRRPRRHPERDRRSQPPEWPPARTLRRIRYLDTHGSYRSVLGRAEGGGEDRGDRPLSRQPRIRKPLGLWLRQGGRHRGLEADTRLPAQQPGIAGGFN